jgi:hypothetical protein
VQLALRPAGSCPEPQAAPAYSTPRPNKLLLASIAMVGAGAIAVTPVAPNVSEIQQRSMAVALTAVNPGVTESPADVYGNLLSGTFASATELGGLLTENPLPILSQFLENQTGYAESILNGFAGIPEAFESFWEGNNGQIRLQNAQAAFQAGDFAEAYDQINRFNIYSLTVLTPITNLFLSADPSGRLPEGRIGIPEQMALNFADVVHAVFNQGSVVTGSTQSFLGPFIGVNFELALAAEALLDAVQEGDFAGAANVLVNTPGTVFNALLNGYVDPTCTEDCERFPGLINGTGPIADFFVRIPNAIAEALKPNPLPGEADEDADAARLVSGVESTEDPALEAIDAAASATAGKAGLVDVEIVAEQPVVDGEIVAEEGAEEAPAKTVKSTPVNPLKAVHDGVAAAVKDAQEGFKNAQEGFKNALTGGRHASNKPATETKTDSSPKHAKDDDSATDAKSDAKADSKADSKDSAKSGAASE